MSYTPVGQQQVGPFSKKSLPDYQAAIQHHRTQFAWALSQNMRHIVERVIDSTVRFGDRYAYISYQNFMDGSRPNPSKGYAGIAPIPHMTRKTFYSVIGSLVDMGILVKDELKYSINYATDALDLAPRPDVQRRVLHENRRGGLLSTVEGIIEWATKLVAHLTGETGAGEKPAEQQDTQENKAIEGCHRIPSTITHTKLPDKSGNNMQSLIQGLIMGKITSEDVKRSILATVASKRDKLDSKRRGRRTLADQVALFEQAWQDGQRKRDSSILPSRILGKHRAILKSQILKPSADTLDTEHFARWTAENWDVVRDAYFSKSSKYPENPAFPWLVACLETYVTAYSNRDHLGDPTFSLSRRDLLRQADTAKHVAANVADASGKQADEIKALKAELNEANARLNKAIRDGKVELTPDEQEMRDALLDKGFTPASELPDWEDCPEPETKSTSRKKRRLRKEAAESLERTRQADAEFDEEAKRIIAKGAALSESGLPDWDEYHWTDGTTRGNVQPTRKRKKHRRKKAK